jgi:hypothetical protein
MVTSSKPATPARLAGGAVGFLVALGLLVGCAGEDSRVVEVFGTASSAELEVSVSTCNAEPAVSAAESSSEVRLTVRARQGRTRTECQDHAWVRLDAPLGDRTVVDAASGEALEVLPPDG